MVYNLLITYDLDKPGQNYDAVHAKIQSLGRWYHPQQSVYYLHTGLSADSAHAGWADSPNDIAVGLFYADLQVSAKTPDLTHDWKHVDVALLQRHEDYFAETIEWLSFLDYEMAVKQERLAAHVWPRPSELDQPPLHNPASQHIPPWLTLDQQSQHLKRAQEREAPPRQPERPPSVVRLTREQWQAKVAKEASEASQIVEKPAEHSD